MFALTKVSDLKVNHSWKRPEPCPGVRFVALLVEGVPLERFPSAGSAVIASAIVDRLRRALAFRISPQIYRAVTLAAVVLLTLIVVTGGAVRLTGSGLGCTDWPTCEKNQVVAPANIHAWVEFGNRIVTGVVAVIVIVAVLGALVRKPRRRDLVWLAAGEVVGVVAQIVLGGLVVLFNLWPPLVMMHFVVSQLLVLDAVVLFDRAGRPDDAVMRPAVDRGLVTLGRVLVGVAALALLTGTVVTGTGPHSGSNGHQIIKRLPFQITSVARVHGTVDMLFLGIVLLFIWYARRIGAPTRVFQRAETLLVIGVLQAAIGYTQYFTGVPEMLVGLHIFGATILWISVLWLHLGLFEPHAAPAESGRGISYADDHLARADLVANR